MKGKLAIIVLNLVEIYSDPADGCVNFASRKVLAVLETQNQRVAQVPKDHDENHGGECDC